MTDVLVSPFAPTQGQRVICLIPADDGFLLVTEDRIAISHGKRVTMDLPIVEIRRIQLDIERRRPATFVIVPDSPGEEWRRIYKNNEWSDVWENQIDGLRGCADVLQVGQVIVVAAMAHIEPRNVHAGRH